MTIRKISGIMILLMGTLLSGCVDASTPPAAPDNNYSSSHIGTLIYVPAGSFQRDNAQTNISVISQPFRMSECEITREQFVAIMGVDSVIAYSHTAFSTGVTSPAACTNWYHAIAFCNKLSLAEGLTPVYSVTVSGVPVDWSILTYTDVPTTFNDDWNAATVSWTNNGYRLPTEMEWMWAAMGAPADGQGGGVNTTGYTKAFAGTKAGVVNIIGDYVWYSANSGTKTHASGTKTENELGLFDMSGNAFEWCWDGYVSNYLAGTLIDYRGPDNYGLYRVLRSGGFASSADQCTIAYRTYSGPNSQVGSVGLRVVRN